MTAPDGTTGKAPDFPLTRLALRVWQYDAQTLMLRSLNTPGGRKPSWVASALAGPAGGWPHAGGMIEATCKRNVEHDEGVPDESCTCGVYATTDLDVINTYLSYDAPVLGVVELGGRTVPATQGYRAQFARVAVILLIDPMFTASHAVLRKLAAAYRVPAVRPHSTDPEDYREIMPASGVADEAERWLRDTGAA